MDIEKFYNSLKAPKKKTDEKPSLINQLTKAPIKDSGNDIPHLSNNILKHGVLQQADLIYLPTDRFGYKYCLTVVDAYDGKCDAEPLKKKYASSITKAFEKIYNRGILQIPNTIQFDSGTEFKGETAEKFKEDYKARIKYALTNRHRQNSMVERKNREIGTTIMKFQNEKELEKKKTVKGWVKYLPSLITAINKHVEKRKRRKLTGEVLYTNKSKDLIPLHSKVRHVLDYPIDVNGKRIGNTFRAGDIRWSKEPQTVEKIILEPDLPPLYQLSKPDSRVIDNRVAYTKSQLQFY